MRGWVREAPGSGVGSGTRSAGLGTQLLPSRAWGPARVLGKRRLKGRTLSPHRPPVPSRMTPIYPLGLTSDVPFSRKSSTTPQAAAGASAGLPHPSPNPSARALDSGQSGHSPLWVIPVR